MIEPGARFPEFNLQDQNETWHSSKQLIGRRTVMFFYPRDDTSGCTLEACGFRDAIPEFRDVTILGVSPDGIKSHAKFAKKLALPYPLLADTGAALCLALGAWVEKSIYGKSYMGVERTTFLIGPDGRVEAVWRKVKPEGHAAEVRAALAQ